MGSFLFPMVPSLATDRRTVCKAQAASPMGILGKWPEVLTEGLLKSLTSWLSISLAKVISLHMSRFSNNPLSLLPGFILTPTAARCLGRKGKGESRPAGRLGVRAEAKSHSQPTAVHLDGVGGTCPNQQPSEGR